MLVIKARPCVQLRLINAGNKKARPCVQLRLINAGNKS